MFSKSKGLSCTQIVLSILTWMMSTELTSYAQAPASLRGTALVGKKFSVKGVNVVLVRNNKGVGNPVPAKVDGSTGEYRIESITPANYNLVASGNRIRTKTQAVQIKPGNENVIDLDLVLAEKRTRVRGRLQGHDEDSPFRKVRIYPAETPPGVCRDCFIGEVMSSKYGDIVFEGIASDESYVFAVEVKGKHANSVITSEPLAIGSEEQATVALHLGGPTNSGSLLIASLVQDAPSDLARKALKTNLPIWTNADRFVPKGYASLEFGPGTWQLSSDARRKVDDIVAASKGTEDSFFGLRAVDTTSSNRNLEKQQQAIVEYLLISHSIRPERILSAHLNQPSNATATATTATSKSEFQLVLLVDKIPGPATPAKTP